MVYRRLGWRRVRTREISNLAILFCRFWRLGEKEGEKEGKTQIAVLEKVNAQPESHAGLACRFQGTTYTYVGRRSHVGAAEPKTMS